MKFNVKASLAAGTLALATIGASANAAMVSYSDSFSFDSTWLYDMSADGTAVTDTSSKNLTLSGFDSSLGTLTDVYVYFDTDWSLTSKVVAYDGWFSDVEGESVAGSEMTVSLTNPTGASENAIETSVANCSGSSWFWTAKCWEKNQESGSFDDVLDLSSISLGAFVDTVLELEVTRTLMSELTTCDTGDWCKAQNKNNGWSGSITVAYEYDDAGPSSSVPEPAMLAVFGLGLLGFSAARRRKA